VTAMARDTVASRIEMIDVNQDPGGLRVRGGSVRVRGLGGYLTSTSSTSKIRAALGGMSSSSPFSP
jgi:hypothetical protein